ncbi:8971_t:CDS:2 [Acaulospora morrowiae]|uniref:8971_t:CDS:1 n=1 Tax=Acaulospora morrowiae TaxID=94023 RepID=A0A9N9DQU8_9GLOM|nr:8971_t:CDS:2 [Acaulospora morrowiae]
MTSKTNDTISALQNAIEISEEIQTIFDQTNCNKEVIKPLAECVKESSLWLVDLNPSEEKCKLAFEKYINVLLKIKSYVNELSRHGNFSERFLKETEEDIKTLHETCMIKHHEAIQEFRLSLNLDYDAPIRKNIERAFTDIVLMNKGIEVPNSELERIRLDPELICDEDDEEPETRGNKEQIKRQLYGSQEVAVKKIEGESRNSIDKYALFMSKLSHCNHIEKFYGTLLIEHDLYVVTEWARIGNLEDFLRSSHEFSWPRRLKIAEQIANALEFLHRAEIYHHNVKSRNVLLDEHLDAKLTGFDSSRFKLQSTTSHYESISRLRWTAPEKSKQNFVPYSKKCDVYSFSIVLWEIGTREKPFKEIADFEVKKHVIEGGRPTPIPTDAPPDYIKLMKEGWSGESKRRPHVQDMRERLHKLVRQNRGGSSSPLPPSLLDNESVDLKNQSQSLFLPSDCNEAVDSEKRVQYPLPSIPDVIKLHSQKKYAEAFQFFQQYAEKEKSATAKFYCGCYLYYEKYGIAKDEDKAIVYLRQAADAGIVDAQFHYAKVCLHGITYDSENGFRYLKKAIEKNYIPALEMWAQILYDGSFGQQINLSEAYKIWEQAERKGSKNAKEKLKLFDKQE